MNKDNDQLSSLYKQTLNEQPSEQVDKNILKLAQQQATKNRAGMRKYLPYSMAASVCLIALLVHNLPQQYDAQMAPPFEHSMPDDIPMEVESTPIQAPNKPSSSQWQYVEQQSIQQKLSRKKVARSSELMQAKMTEIEKQRLMQLDIINKALLTENKATVLKEIQQYITDYSFDSLPQQYKIIYQDSLNETNTVN